MHEKQDREANVTKPPPFNMEMMRHVLGEDRMASIDWGKGCAPFVFTEHQTAEVFFQPDCELVHEPIMQITWKLEDDALTQILSQQLAQCAHLVFHIYPDDNYFYNFTSRLSRLINSLKQVETIKFMFHNKVGAMFTIGIKNPNVVVTFVQVDQIAQSRPSMIDFTDVNLKLHVHSLILENVAFRARNWDLKINTLVLAHANLTLLSNKEWPHSVFQVDELRIARFTTTSKTLQKFLLTCYKLHFEYKCVNFECTGLFDKDVCHTPKDGYFEQCLVEELQKRLPTSTDN